MLQLALAKVALLLTVTSPAASVPLDLDTAAGFSDLLGHGEPTVSAGELVVNPEYITVPKDYVLDEEALSNITSRSQLPVEARDILGGSDNRFQWDGLDYPFETIGKITWGNGVWCSGTLIGPRHVLNARHCTGLDGDNAGNISFAPSFLNGERLGSALVTGVISDPDFSKYGRSDPCWLKNDYAILILDQRIEEQHGYMFLASNPDPAWANRGKLNTYGYPGDKGANTKWCHERILKTVGGCGDNTGPTTTDIDAVGGQSGSAVWHLAADNTTWIWGVLSSVSASDTWLYNAAWLAVRNEGVSLDGPSDILRVVSKAYAFGAAR